MTDERLNEEIDRVLRENEAAIKQVESRSGRLEREAERSKVIVERAMRQIRRQLAR